MKKDNYQLHVLPHVIILLPCKNELYKEKIPKHNNIIFSNKTKVSLFTFKRKMDAR